MKKTGLPLAYPNIPQLSRAAAFPPDTRFPRRGTGGGKPRAAARTYANEKARTHRAGLFHSSGWLAPALRRSRYIIPQPRRRCQALPLYPRCGVAAGVPSRAAPPPEGDGRGRALRRSAWLSPFAAVSSAAPWRKTRSVAALISRRAACSPTPQARAFPIALPFPESGAQRRACCLPLSTVLCYTWGGGVRYGKVPPHDIRRPPAP